MMAEPVSARGEPGVDAAVAGWAGRRLTAAAAVSVRRVMRLALLVQFALAGLLVWADMLGRNPFGAGDPIGPVPTTPFSPGDQRRPYAPTAVPVAPGAPSTPHLPMPPPGEGLAFALQALPELGTAAYLRGAIRPGDDARFERWLDAQTDPPSIAVLHSPGGDVRTALAIGRIIRDRGLTTTVIDDDTCASACPLILAGGVERRVSRAAWIGVHQTALAPGSTLLASQAVYQIQIVQAEIQEHYETMGVDPRLEIIAMKTPPEEVYYLVEDELIALRLATTVTADERP